MDRLVNIRMTADLSQIIQQFTQLNNTLNTVNSSMGGLTGQNMSLGGYAPGMGGVPGGGGGAYGPGMGAGGPAPGVGMSNPRMSNRGQPQQNRSSIGRGDGRDITSMMFGLSQIGFALEDYQYAGWRGVMNNVPWIANAMTSMVAPTLAPYALLATSIGVPLGNMMYENMSPVTKNNISQAFGGIGMSREELDAYEISQLQEKISSLPGLDYRAYQMRAKQARLERTQGMSQAFDEFINTPFTAPASEDAAAGFSEGLRRYSAAGKTGEKGDFNKAIDAAFARDESIRIKKAENDYIENSSTLGITFNYTYDALKAAATSLFSAKSMGDLYDENAKRYFSTVANEGITEQINKTRTEVGSAIKSQDKEKLKKVIGAPYVPDDVRVKLKELLAEIEKAEAEGKAIQSANYQASQMSPTERAARSEGGDLFTGPLSKGMMQKLDYEKRSQDAAAQLNAAQMTQNELRADTARMTDRRGSAISAIVRGSRDSGVAAERIEAFLKGQGVSDEQIQTLLTPDFLKGMQDNMDNRKKTDEQLWEENGNNWIATVKSDILQAQNASYVNGRFRQQVFNSYISKIKIRISDDLAAVGVSRKNIASYADIIFNAAYKEAEQSYKDSREVATNKLMDAGGGVKPTGN